MSRFTMLPRPLLFVLAVAFSLSLVAWSFVWMYYARWQSAVEPSGLLLHEPVTEAAAEVYSVAVESSAAKAGLRQGDRLLAVNGRALQTLGPYFDEVVQGRPGDVVTFRVERAGQAAAFDILYELRAAPMPASPPTRAERIAAELAASFPLLFLVVGIGVLFQRLQDGAAWLLAILFACFICGPGFQDVVPQLPAHLRNVWLSYGIVFAYLGPAVFLCFYATFPAGSPLDQRLPWLKWVAIAAGTLFTLPCAAAAFGTGSSLPFYVRSGTMSNATFRILHDVNLFGWVALGFVALASSAFGQAGRHAQRKVRVLLAGTAIGLGPQILLVFLQGISAHPALRSFWVIVPTYAALMLVPLSMAYAVVKHRVLEIPALLKASVRYVVVRRSFDMVMVIALLIVVSQLNVWAQALDFGWRAGHRLAGQSAAGAEAQVATIVFIFGLAAGAVLASTQRRVRQHYIQRIDRAFFRSVYDSRQILEELAQSIPAAGNRGELAGLIERQILEALHPESLAIYLAAESGSLRLERFTPGPVPATMERLTTDAPVLHELARRGRPWELPPPETPLPNLPQMALLRAHLEQTERRAHRDALAQLAPLEPECLVPILGREIGLTGLVVLGARLSEEPYSDEDEQLLATVARQTGVALENIRLAEEMAANLEAEVKQKNEMAIAREVQAKLFPQRKPPLETLDYAGSCDQARVIGGDYYDFLDLGKGRAGLVLADISGKGIFAALLMANLQANLRSQYALALEDLGGLMRSVNRLFVESVSSGLYATLFIADYADQGRRLRYVNCGHNPPLVVRAGGGHDRLEPTATVVGLIPEWDCTVGETTMAPGDILVVYSDGVTEASSDEGVFFGEERLLETTRAHAALPAEELMRAINRTVHAFSGKEQEDDLTLLVARAR
jgi:sigma-B regulation protein RsbU (phosphoserine phosphatase)